MIKGIIMLSSPADEDFFHQLDPYNIPHRRYRKSRRSLQKYILC